MRIHQCKHFLFVAVILFLLAFSLNAQHMSFTKTTFDNAQESFESEDYKDALYEFQKLYNAGKTNAHICYKIGMCYLNLQGQEVKAIPYLEKAIKNISAKFDDKQISETHAPTHALYYLGNGYRINNELDKALAVYDKFTQTEGFEEVYNKKMVDKEIKSCQRAKVIYDKPVGVKFEHLEEPINTAENNYNAVVSANGKVMAFMRDLKFYSAIMVSFYSDNQWSDPVNINSQVVSDGDFYVSSLSFDGTELYLVKKNRVKRLFSGGDAPEGGSFSGDIYVSKFSNGLWTKAMPLNNNINTSHNESHASISPDGKTLYFSSDRRGGEGKMDIYLSTRNEGDNWGPALNLGPIINTSDDEATPFISSDGTTLYFSSKGHFNMGGYDIFCSRRLANGWTEPVNIGFPLNTTNNDLFFAPLNAHIAYFAKIWPEGSGNKNIFKVFLHPDSLETKNIGEKETDFFKKNFTIKVCKTLDSSPVIVIRYDKELHQFLVADPENYKVVIEDNGK